MVFSLCQNIALRINIQLYVNTTGKVILDKWEMKWQNLHLASQKSFTERGGKYQSWVKTLVLLKSLHHTLQDRNTWMTLLEGKLANM